MNTDSKDNLNNHGGLIRTSNSGTPKPADERIKYLLVNTDLTFKQIIEHLRTEGLTASFNTIRRVNRNNRFRKPRYDAKLTPSQRRQLILQLKTAQKPNLSSLARQYGVCHGSIWYWWDKLSRIREKNNGTIPDNEPSLEFDDGVQQQMTDFNSMQPSSSNSTTNTNSTPPSDHDDLDIEQAHSLEISEQGLSDPLDLVHHRAHPSSHHHQFHHKAHQHRNINLNNNMNLNNHLNNLQFIGPVKAKSRHGNYIDIPILMYS